MSEPVSALLRDHAECEAEEMCDVLTEAADLIDALVEALERAHHACVTLDNYGAMNRVMLITTEALARAKGEPK